jgi:hypothetical protein
MLALAVCPSPPKVVGKYVKPGGNFLEVEAAPDDKVNVNLAGSYGMNTCQIDTGPQKISDCTITYTENEDGDNCTIRISFEGQIARVEQHGGCGCGLNVNLSGTYRKQRKVSEKGSNRSVPSREAG